MGAKHFSQEQKLAILRSAAQVGIKEAAQIAGVHYTTVYEWRNNLESLGEEGFLAYNPSWPGRGIKEISPEQEASILEVWRRHPGYGSGQVRNQLRRQGMTVSSRTVRRVMEANGYKARRKGGRAKEIRRFEARRPLELVQVDMLEFYIHKQKVYLGLLLDDFSRFVLGYRLMGQSSIDEMIMLVQGAMDRYGKMEEILSDRGFVFYGWHGANRFERFLEVEGIDHTHASSHHPQTLGKVEALNRQIQKELIGVREFCSLRDGQSAFSEWVEHYNYERTHQGLGGFLVPADRFHGRVSQVKEAIGAKMDVNSQTCYKMEKLPRSLLSLALTPEGELVLYWLGRPIFQGGTYGRSTDQAGGGGSDSGSTDCSGKRS